MMPVKSPSGASGGLKVVVTFVLELAGTVTLFAAEGERAGLRGATGSATVNRLSARVVSTAEVLT